MAKIPLSSGQTAFPMTFHVGLGGVFGYKSGLGFSFRALEVPFLVPPKSPKTCTAFSDLKERSNPKVEENKLALKFNFALEYM